MTTYTVNVSADGTKYWYLNNRLHRPDGPAIEHSGGGNEWYFNGKRHRTDGPAHDFIGNKWWYLNGVKHTEVEFNTKMNSCEDNIVEIDGKKYKLVSH